MSAGRTAQSGFTLVEMAAAMTLLGLAFVLLFEAVHLGLRFQEEAREQLSRQEAIRTATAFVRRQIRQARPLLRQEKNGRWRIAFAGERDFIELVGPAPAGREPGLWHIRLAFERQAAGRNLVFSYRPLLWQQAARERVVLLTGLEEGAFEFQGGSIGRGWSPAWSDAERLPERVRMRVKPAGGERWPDLVVAVRGDRDAATTF